MSPYPIPLTRNRLSLCRRLLPNGIIVLRSSIFKEKNTDSSFSFRIGSSLVLLSWARILMPPRWLDEKIKFLTPIRLGYHKNVVFNHLCSEFELPCALLPSIKAVHKRSRQLVCYSVRSSSYQKEFIAAGFVLSGDSYILAA